MTIDEGMGVIAKFLATFGQAAAGHGRETLTRDEEEQLRRLALGELEEEERGGLVPLLVHNEVAMEFLAKVAT